MTLTTSTSHRVLQALIGLPSVALALVAAFATPRGTLAGAFILIVLTPFAVLGPSTRITTLLLVLHAVNWLSGTAAPAGAREWALTLFAALAMVTMHLAASLAAATPPASPLPRETVARWLRRSGVVVALSAVVWAVLVAQTSQAPEGVPLMTYAALASLAVLGLALWLTHTQSSGEAGAGGGSGSASGLGSTKGSSGR